MAGKGKRVTDSFCQDFKGLPLKMRVRMILTAKKILEIQKEKKVFLGNAIDPSLYEGGGKR